MAQLARSARDTVSEKWSVFSMPSALRKAKTKLAGPSKMSNDPLEVQRNELRDFGSLVSSLSACANTLSCAVDMLGTAPKPLFEPLRQLYDQDGSTDGQAVLKLCHDLEGFAARVKENEVQIQVLQDNLRGLSEQNRQCQQSFTARDKAFTEHDHYVKKLEALRDQITKSGSSPKLADKLNRNEEKRLETEKKLEEASMETSRAAQEHLATRRRDLGEVLAKFCQYYHAVFQASAHLGQELGRLAGELRGGLAGSSSASVFGSGNFSSGWSSATTAASSAFSGFPTPTAQPPTKSPKGESFRQPRTPRSSSHTPRSHSSSHQDFGGFGGFPSWPSQESNAAPAAWPAPAAPSPWASSSPAQSHRSLGGYPGHGHPESHGQSSPWGSSPPAQRPRPGSSAFLSPWD
eukprot:TRINITY_DN102648_c0_g1_i1.p1 TRINITY_DN102648_c0_g1~~TRINITY_DN102648_c0_g1_i1.p1  ORF type:complete len:418 (-),score=64.56 TRINITY_DN102648_c0_g1_i1:58-1272(-)